MKQQIRYIAAAIVLGAWSVGAARAQAVGHHPALHTSPAFVFGREGGNIRPFTVTIAASGIVSTTGSIGVLVPHPQLPQDTLDGLRKLASAEGFATLPTRIEGKGLNPDVASLFITMPVAGSMKQVQVHGTRNVAFAQLFAVLMAAAGVTY